MRGSVASYVFSTPTTSAPKLVPIKKIKHKKKALEAEQARHAQAKPYLVSTEELLSLAQYVAKCDRPPIVIPASILSAVKRTIKPVKAATIITPRLEQVPTQMTAMPISYTPLRQFLSY